MFRDLHENADIIIFILCIVNIAAGIWAGYRYAINKNEDRDDEMFHAGWDQGYSAALADVINKMHERVNGNG